jgi:hypothetical protein
MAVRRDEAARGPILAAVATFVGYFLVHAAWLDWRGGSCYGPRLLVPALPALVVLAVHCPLTSRIARVALAGAFAYGFTVSACAALAPWRAFWGSTPLELVSSRAVGAVAAAGVAVAVAVWAERRGFVRTASEPALREPRGRA